MLLLEKILDLMKKISVYMTMSIFFCLVSHWLSAVERVLLTFVVPLIHTSLSMALICFRSGWVGGRFIKLYDSFQFAFCPHVRIAILSPIVTHFDVCVMNNC
jgi:hypothetical protein